MSEKKMDGYQTWVVRAGLRWPGPAGGSAQSIECVITVEPNCTFAVNGLLQVLYPGAEVEWSSLEDGSLNIVDS